MKQKCWITEHSSRPPLVLKPECIWWESQNCCSFCDHYLGIFSLATKVLVVLTPGQKKQALIFSSATKQSLDRIIYNAAAGVRCRDPGPGRGAAAAAGNTKTFYLSNKTSEQGRWWLGRGRGNSYRHNPIYLYKKSAVCMHVSASNELGPVEYGFTFDYSTFHNP